MTPQAEPTFNRRIPVTAHSEKHGYHSEIRNPVHESENSECQSASSETLLFRSDRTTPPEIKSPNTSGTHVRFRSDDAAEENQIPESFGNAFRSYSFLGIVVPQRCYYPGS